MDTNFGPDSVRLRESWLYMTLILRSLHLRILSVGWKFVFLFWNQKFDFESFTYGNLILIEALFSYFHKIPSLIWYLYIWESHFDWNLVFSLWNKNLILRYLYLQILFWCIFWLHTDQTIPQHLIWTQINSQNRGTFPIPQKYRVCIWYFILIKRLRNKFCTNFKNSQGISRFSVYCDFSFGKGRSFSDIWATQNRNWIVIVRPTF